MPAPKKVATEEPKPNPKPTSKSKSLVVTAPLVQVRLGDRDVQFHHGDVLPDGISEDSLEHLKSLDYVTEGEASAELTEQ